MKKLTVQLSTNETIVHIGDDMYTLKNDFGFIIVRDIKNLPDGGRQDKHLATYNPAFIVSIRDAGA